MRTTTNRTAARRPPRGLLATGAAALAATLLLTPAARAAERPTSSPPGAARLSDEVKLTRWASATQRATVFTRPTTKARKAGKLRLLTEDGFPEVYLLLSRWTDDDGNDWVRVRLPARPNGQKGWVRREALGDFNRVTTRIVVSKTDLRATLYRSGKKVFSARVGVGAPATPTPSGQFYIREKFRVLPGGTIYGTHAIGTSAYAPTLSDWPGGGVVGLHGTNQPQLIPGRPSHGCIRLRNADIARFYKLAPRGTPVRIL
jgi:lipoprotein-anchoring transpeptidase ErfK/SrfK